jgi:hypothetical protein
MNEIETTTCVNCGKVCKDKRGLSIHAAKCLSDKPPPDTVCSYCNMTLKSIYNLERHLLTCTELKVYRQKEEYERIIAELNVQKEEEINRIRRETNEKIDKLQKEVQYAETLKQEQINKLEKEVQNVENLRQGQLRTYHEESHRQIQENQLLTKKLEEEIKRTERLVQQFEKEKKELTRDNKELRLNNSALVNNHLTLAKLQQAHHSNNTTINNFHTNTFQVYNFDPSKFRGKIPPNLLITSEDQLVNHLIENGIKNYYRVTDRSRGTIIWVDQKGQEIRDSGGTALTSQLYDTLHEDFLAQKEYSSQQLDKDNLTDDQYSKYRKSVNVSNKILQKNPDSIKEVGKKLGKQGINKSDTVSPTSNPSSITLQHFYTVVGSRLCENVLEWLWLEFDDFAIFLYNLIKDQIITRTHTHLHRPYFSVHSDFREEIQLYWNDIPVILQRSLNDYFYSGSSQTVINQLITLRKESSILQWLEEPSEEISKEIITSLLKA